MTTYGATWGPTYNQLPKPIMPNSSYHNAMQFVASEKHAQMKQYNRNIQSLRNKFTKLQTDFKNTLTSIHMIITQNMNTTSSFKNILKTNIEIINNTLKSTELNNREKIKEIIGLLDIIFVDVNDKFIESIEKKDSAAFNKYFQLAEHIERYIHYILVLFTRATNSIKNESKINEAKMKLNEHARSILNLLRDLKNTSDNEYTQLYDKLDEIYNPPITPIGGGLTLQKKAYKTRSKRSKMRSKTRSNRSKTRSKTRSIRR